MIHCSHVLARWVWGHNSKRILLSKLGVYCDAIFPSEILKYSLIAQNNDIVAIVIARPCG